MQPTEAMSPFNQIAALQLRSALENGIVCDALQMPHVCTAATAKDIYVREPLSNLGKLFAKFYWVARNEDLCVVQLRVATPRCIRDNAAQTFHPQAMGQAV
jgi:hypothetical protein